MWWITAGVIVVLLLLFGGRAIGAAIRKKICGRRQDGNPFVTYFTEKDFDGLVKDPVTIPAKGGVKLGGGIYRAGDLDQCRGLVIFVHGMGGGHLSYTTEINHFAKQGFAVLGYDNTGTMASTGENLIGIHRTVLDLQSALQYVQSRNDLKDLPLLLAGHSWGGFSVSCAPLLKEAAKVKGIVAFSGFNKYQDLISDLAGMKWIKPFLLLDEVMTFGIKGTWCAEKAYRKTSIPILAIHGEKDDTVQMYACAATALQKAGGNAVFLADKYHNPYNTCEAEAALRKFIAESAALHREGTPAQEEIKAFYDSVDFRLLTEEDAEVMALADKFMDDCLKGC